MERQEQNRSSRVMVGREAALQKEVEEKEEKPRRRRVSGVGKGGLEEPGRR